MQKTAAGAGAGALVLILVAGLVPGPLSSHGSNGPIGPRPRIAAASESAAVSSSASVAASAAQSVAASASASQSATVGPPQIAEVLSTVSCDPDWTQVTADGRLYVSCSDGAQIIAIDLATDEVARTYKVTRPYNNPPDEMIVDGGLWLSFSNDEGTQFDVQRLDLTTGAKSVEFKNSVLIGEVGGTIVMADKGKNLYKVNPANGTRTAWPTDAQGTVGDPTQYVPVACGKLWDLGQRDSIGRVDPASGEEIYLDDTGPNGAWDVVQTGDTCWGVFDSNPSTTPDTDPFVLTQLGSTCMGTTGAKFTGEPFVLGDAFWEIVGNQATELDPITGKLGSTWILPSINDEWLTLAEGQVWLADDSGVHRLDVQLDQMTHEPSSFALVCPAPAPTDSPSPSPSPSDSASPSEMPTAGVTPTPTPTPSPTPTPTPLPSPSPSPSPSPTPSPTPTTSPTAADTSSAPPADLAS
jgi:hypothetical protein